MRRRSSLLFLLAFVLIQFNTDGFKVLADQRACTPCHSNITRGAHIHPALNMGCNQCHTMTPGKNHPKESGSVKLSLDMPHLCYKCHREASFTGSYVHPPVAKGQCETCHDPHHSDIQEPLKAEPLEICFGCHAEEKFTRKYVHGVALGGCSKKCHNPHASDYPKLLQTDVNTLCIGCHKKQQSGNHIVSLPRGKIHPVFGVPFPGNRKKLIDCASCHSPHSSNYAKLFTSKKKCRLCHKGY